MLKYFHENEFACHILKGSAVARYYLHQLRRSSGDIDVCLDSERNKMSDFPRAFDKD